MPMYYDPEQIEVQYLNDFMMLEGKRVLEVGCGDSRMMRRYAQLTRMTTGIDVDFERLQNALVQQPDTLYANVSHLQANGTTLPFKSQHFHVAILGWSL